MFAVSSSRRHGAWLLPLAIVAVSFVACGDDEPTGPVAPADFEITAETSADSVTVSWDAQTSVDSFKVELTWNPTLTQWVAGTATEAVFTSDDGLEDGVDATASAEAYNAAGSTASNTAPVTTDFFPWDEYYPTSLHGTRVGKGTFYNTSPNMGAESMTGVPLSSLPCTGCHWEGQPGAPNGCQGCHTEENPGLGAEVDDSMEGVCVKCHSRLATEVSLGYSDVHRDAGMTCMDCHSMEDVHGDGNTYASMFDDGAIDAKCSNCHEDVSGVGGSYHSIHEASVDCSTCHMQTVVTCYNCHLEGQLENPPIKKARAKLHGWKFLVNRHNKVYPATFQSLEYQDTTFLAWGVYFSHTIDKNAVSSCTDCHGNANMQDLAADSILEVVKWDGINPPAGDAGFTTLTGVIPVPFNYQTALKFDFFHWDGTNWSFVKTGPDGWQMIPQYFTPLTDAQLQKID